MNTSKRHSAANTVVVSVNKFRANEIRRRADIISQVAKEVASGLISERQALSELSEAGYVVNPRRLRREVKGFSDAQVSDHNVSDIVREHLEMLEWFHG